MQSLSWSSKQGLRCFPESSAAGVVGDRAAAAALLGGTGVAAVTPHSASWAASRPFTAVNTCRCECSHGLHARPPFARAPSKLWHHCGHAAWSSMCSAPMSFSDGPLAFSGIIIWRSAQVHMVDLGACSTSSACPHAAPSRYLASCLA